MNYHDKSLREIEKILSTNLELGLSDEQAQIRLKKYGPNVIKEKNKIGLLRKFLGQFNDFMVIILLIAAAVSFFISFFQNKNDYIDPIIILVIVFSNALIGFIQENKAEKSIEALKKMAVPTAKVIRGGKMKSIPASDVVVGDLIVLETGDCIVADARLISSTNLKMEESALTGESVASEKNADEILLPDAILSERINMVYSSSFVNYGRGRAIVIATGMDTQVGQIADMIMTNEQVETPLQKKLEHTGKVLGIGALFICGIIFAMGVCRNISPFEMFMTSVSLAVAAIPEGLPAIVTIVLAIGVRRMAKANAIIKKLPAVETLGCANIICSDKTGTLTQNKMRVVETRSYLENREQILKQACLCNNALVKKSEGNFETLGDSTEVALILAAMESGMDKNKLERQYERVWEIPFDSQRKLMTTVHKNEGEYLIITKGAPDFLLAHCKYYMEAGKRCELNLQMRKKIATDNKNMAAKALRVIGIAHKLQKKFDTNQSDIESDLVFSGLIGMIDPPREEVADAVYKCKMAGIKPVMITGDHIVTAQAIAKKLGIMQTTDKAMSGSELAKINEVQLSKNIFDYSVFARVSPEDKVKIVKAYQKNNAVVAMTGDGVNDAPALKTADIGCAMGKSGTDVAKSAADMILTDDNFSTIVKAVREGRGIYSNIKKAIHFLLSSNIGEIITIFMAIFFGWKAPLLAIQLLWVNLVTDSLPAIALGLEPTENDVMKQLPIKNSQGLFKKQLWIRIIIEGAMIGMLSLLAYGIGNVYYNLIVARTMAFATLSISQLVHVFNMRSEKSIFSMNFFGNTYIILAFIICFILQAAVIMIKPLSFIFHVQSLNIIQWLIVIFLSCMPVLIVEIEKYTSR